MTLSLVNLTLRREGSFLQRVTGDHHCGPKALLVDSHEDGTQEKGWPGYRKPGTLYKAIPVRYNLTAVCGPVLDHRGFLFDQAMVDAWFVLKGRTETSLSCEAYAVQLANQFLEKLGRDAPHCDMLSCTLQLSPAPYAASITAIFTKP